MTSHTEIINSYVVVKNNLFDRQERKVIKYLKYIRYRRYWPLRATATPASGLPDIRSGSDGGDDDGDDYSLPRREHMGAGGRVRVPARWRRRHWRKCC